MDTRQKPVRSSRTKKNGSSVHKLEMLKNATSFDVNELQSCVDHGQLPTKLFHYFEMLRFLSRVVVAAQDAQRHYGVPASILIAKAAVDSCWDGTLSRQYFLAEARQLAKNPQFSPVVKSNIHPVAMVKRLCECGLGDGLYAMDITGIIIEYELNECDQAGSVPSGQYRRNFLQQTERPPRYYMA